MATTTAILVRALRETARRLQAETTPYKWAHFGQCNCGHLAQTLTGLSDVSLQHAAEKHRGDWSEQAVAHERAAAIAGPSSGPSSEPRSEPSERPFIDYGDRLALDEGAWEPEANESCAITDIPMSLVFAHLTAIGLTAEDFVHLERLTDPRVRRLLGTNTREFHYASRDNLIAYLGAWATLLEQAQQSSPAPSTPVLPIADGVAGGGFMPALRALAPIAAE